MLTFKGEDIQKRTYRRGQTGEKIQEGTNRRENLGEEMQKEIQERTYSK